MLEEEIKAIERAITYVQNDDMIGLAYDNDCWDDGIHEHMDSSTIPFELSFDEEMADRTECEIQELRPYMMEWLEDALKHALDLRNTDIKA